MRIHISPSAERLRSFAGQLPELFDRHGETLHDGRNTIKRFVVDGYDLVVKRFRRPNPIQKVAYSFFRRGKARRSYEHAERLRRLGIDSPEPLGWIECRPHGLLRDSYYICRYSDYASLSSVTARYPDPETLPVLEAFARFVVLLHDKGIEHDDFNHGNILWQRDPETCGFRFQLIDINRMHFAPNPLTQRKGLIVLRRLSCPPEAFLYVLNRYAELRGGRDVEDTLLHGIFLRLLFKRRRALRKRIRKHLGPHRQQSAVQTSRNGKN